jgi:hypothetical protein
MWQTEMSMLQEISYIKRLDTFLNREIRTIRTKPFLGLDEAIVDGCGLPRQMKREAHGFSRAEQVTADANRKYTLRFDTDERGFELTLESPSVHDPKVDLRLFMPPVFNQGELGSCFVGDT